ncbi:MAG: dTDP-4-dehydrorhamnose 3,5-epimerase [Planctomycetes bacterium]|jgi:dTDP-4-dehydrorhamnose 3,5-epimerase|nr:dTDP-4-dehydrorhamnose 3,5-epimerase [Planctomycetota bacterium]
MNRISTELEGVWIFEPKVFGDARGFFMETWNRKRYAEAGLDVTFVQDNVSRSRRGVLRGLHYQKPNAQGKLVQVLEGHVLDVAVDIRVGSPTFGRFAAVHLSDENFRQLYIPPGFAHGFCVLSETAIFAYKCTNYYTPSAEGGVLWNDPDLNIPWDIDEPQLSDKDKAYRRLKDIPENQLPRYGECA